MPLKRITYRVYLTGDDVDGDGRTVEVTHADMLRAELEAKKHGLSADSRENPMHAATLWVWSAMVRTGDTAEKFRDFTAAQLVGFEQDKGVVGDQDPTRTAEPSNSASASPVPSPAPDSGLTPTSPTS